MDQPLPLRKSRKSKHTGKTFNKWTLLEVDPVKRPNYHICRCECGTVKSLFTPDVIKGKTTQCNKCRSDMAMSVRGHNIGHRQGFIEVIGIVRLEDKNHYQIKCDCGGTVYKRNICNVRTCGMCNLARPNAKNLDLILSIGSKRGRLTVKERIGKDRALCVCDCGKELVVRKHCLLNKFPSCGCYLKDRREEEAKTKIGKVFGRLTITKWLGYRDYRGKKLSFYLLKCKCGNTIEKNSATLTNAGSCGCLYKLSALRGENAPNAKIRNFEVKSLKDLYATGAYTKEDLGEMFDLKEQHLRDILRGKIWGHIK